ncbi:MAG: hypothetical protein K8T89_18360 [Planctomycetes bacterium]|nr:hypothetical protein [Planctomycetota bacterium]
MFSLRCTVNISARLPAASDLLASGDPLTSLDSWVLFYGSSGLFFRAIRRG